MREGIDPRDEKKAAIAQKVEDELMGVTLRQLADDYMNRKGKLKQSSKDTIERHVVTTFKAWANLPVVQITEEMCRTRYKEIAAKGHTLYERANGPDTVLVKVVPGQIVWGEAASMEMFVDATKKPREDDEGGGGSGGRGQALDAGALQVLVEMVLELQPGEHITREDVEREHGKPVNRKRWAKIDDHLNLHPVVLVERGGKNRVLYGRRPVVQKAP